MRTFFACLFLIIIGTLIYALILRGVWENPTPSIIKQRMNEPIKPHGTTERGRFLLTQNLVENHSFALTREQADAAAPDAGYYKGNWFVLYPPGISIFAIPFYVFGLQFKLSQVFTFLMVTLFSIANLIIIFLISRQILKLSYWVSMFASLIFGFASTSLSYVASLYQHLPTVYFTLFSFYAVYQYKIHKKWGFPWGFIIWLNYALAILIDYPNAFLMLPVMVYFLIVSINIRKSEMKYKISFRPAVILTSLFFVTITFLHGYYNNVNYGGWTKLSGSLAGYREGVAESLDKGEDLEQNIKKLSQNKNPVGFLRETNLANSSYELLIALDKGIFVFSPIFILGLFGIFLTVRKNKVNLEIGILIALVVVNVFFYSSWGDPWGGWAFGPRYLIPTMAFLSFFIAIFLTEVKFKLLSRLFTFVLFIVSAAISIVGALTTNAVPPETEANFLKIKYGFFFAADLLAHGHTNSFLFNYFLHERLNLMQYYLIILVSISFIAFIVLFILPLFSRQKVEE